MTIKPIPDWASTYASKLNAYYVRAKTNPSEPIANFWSDWVDTNTQGIESAPPYAGAKGTTTAAAFAPVIFSPTMLPPQSAKVLADAWKAYAMATVWTPPAPAPPFSVILAVQPSALGVTAAYAALLAGLTAEFLTLPPDPASALTLKALAIATLFYTATLAGGIDLAGLALAGTPPPPVDVPFSGVL